MSNDAAPQTWPVYTPADVLSAPIYQLALCACEISMQWALHAQPSLVEACNWRDSRRLPVNSCAEGGFRSSGVPGYAGTLTAQRWVIDGSEDALLTAAWLVWMDRRRMVISSPPKVSCTCMSQFACVCLISDIALLDVLKRCESAAGSLLQPTEARHSRPTPQGISIYMCVISNGLSAVASCSRSPANHPLHAQSNMQNACVNLT